MTLIVGDIGGTNARLAWVAWQQGLPVLEGIRVFSSSEYPDFGAILQAFAGDIQATAACIGVPGPVRDNRCRVTNLPWQLDGAELARAAGIGRVSLLNDLEAAACGLDAVADDQLVCLQAGDAVDHGNQVVIAPGTGLGEAGRVFDGSAYRAFATEGGHASFAPYDEQSFALQQWLKRAYGHVSWERLLSGAGLSAIDYFLAQWQGTGGEQREAAAVTAAAAGGEARAQTALHWFVRMLGMEASNLALKWMAGGGVYIAGGIAPRIAEHLQAGFLESFLDKGRMVAVLQAMPVWLVTDPHLAMRGAALYSAGAGRLH